MRRSNSRSARPGKTKPEAGRMPNQKTCRMAVVDLQPADYNPRTISDEALQGLAASVGRFCCVQPVTWNKRTKHVADGHQRLRVLQAKGQTETNIAVVDRPLKEEKALNVALNIAAITGEFTAARAEALSAPPSGAQPDRTAGWVPRAGGVHPDG